MYADALVPGPEPSTYVELGLGTLCIFYLMRGRLGPPELRRLRPESYLRTRSAAVRATRVNRADGRAMAAQLYVDGRVRTIRSVGRSRLLPWSVLPQ